MEEAAEQGVSNRWFWGFLRRWGWMLILGFFLGTGIGYVLADRMSKDTSDQYTSEAFVLIRASVTPSAGGSASLVQQIPILAVSAKRTEVLEAVVAELPPEWNLTAELLEKRILASGPGTSAVPGLRIQVGPGVPVRDITIPTLSIRVTDTDKDRAQIIANSLARALMDYANQQQRDGYKRLDDQGAQGIDVIEKTLGDALQTRNASVFQTSDQIGADLVAAEESLSALSATVAESLDELRTALESADAAALVELRTALASTDPEALVNLRTALDSTDAEASYGAFERVDKLTQDMVTRYDAFLSSLRDTQATLDDIVGDPDFQLAQTRVGALTRGYEAEIRNRITSQVSLANIEPALELLQEAPRGVKTTFVVRKRDLPALLGSRYPSPSFSSGSV